MSAQGGIRPWPGSAPRTGLPFLKPYVYRGTGVDTLTPSMPGRVPPREFRRRVVDGVCAGCDYPLTAMGHKIECGDES